MNQKILFSIGIFILFCSGNIAQTLDWELSYSPQARHVSAGHIADNGELFVFGGSPRNDSIEFIARSSDSGTSWTIVKDTPFKPKINDVTYASQTIAFAIGDAGSIQKSTDGGYNWVYQSVVSNLRTRQFRGIHCITADSAFIVGGNLSNDSITTILRTVNGGTNWQKKMDAPGPRLNDVHFYKNMHGIAVGDLGTVFTTINGGSSWSPRTISGNAGQRKFNAACMVNENTMLIVGGNPSNDSIQTILRSTDGGNNWQVIKDNLNPMLNDIDFLNDGKTGIAVGDQGVAYSTFDTGKTWSLITLPMNNKSHLNSINYLGPKNAIIGGQFGTVYYSFDQNTLSNETWTQKQLVLYPNPVNQLLTLNNIELFSNLQLYTISGVSVALKHTSFNQLDFKNIPTGIYMLQYTNKFGLTSHQKIQKL